VIPAFEQAQLNVVTGRKRKKTLRQFNGHLFILITLQKSRRKGQIQRAAQNKM
jgi:hypothetical protein